MTQRKVHGDVAYVAQGDGAIPFSGPGAKQAAVLACRGVRSGAAYWQSIEDALEDSLPPSYEVRRGTGEGEAAARFWREARLGHRGI